MSLAELAVVVTRTREQNAELRELLRGRGAQVISLPTIRFTPMRPNDAEQTLVEDPDQSTHLVFTSQTAVRFFGRLCDELGVELEHWRAHAVAAVGAATAAVCRDHGWEPQLVAESPRGAALAEELLATGTLGASSHVLAPQSALARPELAEKLRAAGVRVSPLVVYDTVDEDAGCAREFLLALEAGPPPGALLFASPSAVAAFARLTGAPGLGLLTGGDALVVAIGPTTARALADLGVSAPIEADAPGAAGLVDALERAAQG